MIIHQARGLGRSGGYDGREYEKQRQPAEHDNLLNAAGIEFE